MKSGRLIASLLLSVFLIDFARSQSGVESPVAKIGPELDLEKLLAARLNSEELRQGWIRLFDGQTLMGWTKTDGANWRVKDNAIVATEGTNSLLCTSVPFSDYEVSLDFRIQL